MANLWFPRRCLPSRERQALGDAAFCAPKSGRKSAASFDSAGHDQGAAAPWTPFSPHRGRGEK